MYKLYKNEIISYKTEKGRRKNNEDSILETIHPRNDKYKLLAVADGVGGAPSGDLASTFVLEKLKNIFMMTPTIVLKSEYLSKIYLEKIIKHINNALIERNDKTYEKDNGPATTLTCAIVLDKITLIASIGDSRAYATINGKLKQITEDNSLVWQLYENGFINKDDIRFRKDNNIITKCLGRTYDNDVTIYTLNNDEYTNLLLVTDGVTDCLSDKKIEFIVKNTMNNDAAYNLVYEAVYIQQDNIIPEGYDYEQTYCGKDNSSAVILTKKLTKK